MLTPAELATIEAFMAETENIDEYKRALAVVSLEAGNPLDKIGISVKHVQRMRRAFRSIGTGHGQFTQPAHFMASPFTASDFRY